MIDKLIEIAKANGAQTSFNGWVLNMTDDQSRAAIEQVCAPLVEDAKNLLDIIGDWKKKLGAVMDRDELIMVAVAADNLENIRSLIGGKE